MKTSQEIAEYYGKVQAKDLFGHTGEILVPYLSTELAKPFLNEGVDLSDWKPAVLTHEGVLAEMKEYMEFAWGKVEDHRGLSASRSVEKMQAWLWLLGDEETLAFARDDANYPQYGAPILKKICDVYGFSVPDGDDIARMAQGKPCYEGCSEGCGK